MAETIAGSYASLAGLEIVNNNRTFAYLRNGLAPPNLKLYGDCGCPTLIESLNCPGLTEYTDPVTDQAPWYSEGIPESARFAGFLATEFEGLDSPFERKVIESINHGGVPGRGRLKSREMTWRGYLFGADCCAVAYGLRWLAKALARQISCQDCYGDELEINVCCPEDTSVYPFRTLKNVVLTEGPTIQDQRPIGCGSCGGACVMEIEFVLVAAQPYLYSAPIAIYSNESLTENAIDPLTQATIECGDPNCSDVWFDPETGLCPLPVSPPTADYVNTCIPDWDIAKASYFSVPRSTWKELEEVVPIISIRAGAMPLQHIQLGFYSSASELPCQDLIDYPPDCDVMCDQLELFIIPADSTFYIDGRTRKMTLICPDGSAYPGERLTSGPWSWPSFDCYGFCMEVKYESQTTLAGELYTTISLTVVPRTF